MDTCWGRFARAAPLKASCCIVVFVCLHGLLGAQSSSEEEYGSLAATQLRHAADDLAKIKLLVDQGTLPRTRIAEAQARLDDARDELVLTKTLYGSTTLHDLTDDQAQAMLAAAQRRVDRQAGLVEGRQKLVDNGVVAKSEISSLDQELDSRRRVLSLAENRVKLVSELRQMAETEQRLAQTSGSMPGNEMIRYDGNGLFSLGDLTTITNEFQRKFHRSLPVSALGQTLVHRSMGLDHRNRVDVALNPDTEEGVWLRHLLERLHIPYLGFRNAVAGAATAPHIHIGPGSTRLALTTVNPKINAPRTVRK